MTAFPTSIDTAKPLPDEVKLYVAEHGTSILRALLTELDLLNTKLRTTERQLADARSRLRDSRGLFD